MARSERLPAASEYQRRYDPYLVKSSGAHENNPEDDQFHQVSVTQAFVLPSVLILLLTYSWKVIIRSCFAFFFF